MISLGCTISWVCIFVFICSSALGCSYLIITDLIDTIKARRIKRNRLRALAYKIKKRKKNESIYHIH
jgi:hypothetical protein